MKRYQNFVGIDVSKKWLDFALFVPETGEVHSVQIDNSLSSIQEYLSVELSGYELSSILFCLENTGRYDDTFLEVGALEALNICLEHPLQIKRSQGMIRGKNDKDDAIRIAEYAYRFEDKLTIWSPKDDKIVELQEMLTKRELLVKTKKQLTQASSGPKDKEFKTPIKAIGTVIGKIEIIIRNIIKSSKELARYDELLQSIPGVGKVLSSTLIVMTEGFTILQDPRKLSCYAGIAPFGYQSGSSINYKKKISKNGE